MKHSTKSEIKQKVNLAFEAIGTKWSIDLAVEPSRARAVSKLIADRISDFDKTYSRFRADSWVTRIRKPGSYPVPRDFTSLYSLYQKLYTQTNGAVTPLIGDAMERAGYDAHYSLKPGGLKAIPKLEDALQLNHNTLHVKYSCVLDFGAAGKGYLVDILGNLLLEEDIQDFLIDAGGDILHHSPAPTAKSTPVGIEIALEDPKNPKKAIGTVVVSNQSVCGSASNRRAWGGMHHIIDPRSLAPTEEVIAIWVVADTAVEADGLATALFFVEPEAIKNFDFEYVILRADNSINVSKEFPGELFHEQRT